MQEENFQNPPANIIYPPANDAGPNSLNQTESPQQKNNQSPVQNSPKTALPARGQNQAFENLLKELRQELIIEGYSSKTLKMYLLYCGEMLYHINKPVESIEKRDVVDYLASKKEAGCANSTLSLAHAAMEYMFKRHLKMNVLEDIKIPKKAKTLPKVLTRDEIRALFENTKFGRNRLMLQFMYGSGCRVSEVVKLKVEDLNFKEKTATIRGGKGNKDRFIILSKDWVHGVKKYLDKKKIKSEFVFSKKTNRKSLTTDTVQRIVRKAAAKAGINKRVTPHCLRHCLEANTRIFMRNRLCSAKELYEKKGGKIKSFDFEKMKLTDSNIITKTKHNTNEMLSIWADGYELVCSPEHKLFTITSQGIAETEAENLKTGQFLLGVKKVNFKGKKIFGAAFCRFLGYCLGDGVVSKSRRGVILFDKNISNLFIYQKILENEFGKKAFIRDVKGTNSKQLIFYSKKLVDYLRKIGFDKRSKYKRVPKMLFGATKEEIEQFLAGFYDAEGNEGSIRFFSSSKDLLKDVQMLLLSFGIDSHLNKRNRTVRLPQGNLFNSTIFTLGVLHKPDQEKFVKQISTFKKLGVLNDFQGEKTPANVIFKELFKIFKKEKPGFIYKIQNNQGIKHLARYSMLNPTKNTVLKIVKEMKKENYLPEYSKLLTELSKPNIKWLKIKKIEKIKETSKIFDFGVAKTHTLITDGFVSHNSYATHLLEAGTNIRYIQSLLGHSSLNTTQVYTNVASEQLKKIVSPLDKL